MLVKEMLELWQKGQRRGGKEELGEEVKAGGFNMKEIIYLFGLVLN